MARHTLLANVGTDSFGCQCAAFLVTSRLPGANATAKDLAALRHCHLLTWYVGHTTMPATALALVLSSLPQQTWQRCMFDEPVDRSAALHQRLTTPLLYQVGKKNVCEFAVSGCLPFVCIIAARMHSGALVHFFAGLCQASSCRSTTT